MLPDSQPSFLQMQHHKTAATINRDPAAEINTTYNKGPPPSADCLMDILTWMKQHQLQLNLAKTDFLIFPVTPTVQYNLTIQLGSTTILLSTTMTIKDPAGLHCTTSGTSGPS